VLEYFTSTFLKFNDRCPELNAVSFSLSPFSMKQKEDEERKCFTEIVA
jgi:hypothetical protein